MGRLWTGSTIRSWMYSLYSILALSKVVARLEMHGQQKSSPFWSSPGAANAVSLIPGMTVLELKAVEADLGTPGDQESGHSQDQSSCWQHYDKSPMLSFPHARGSSLVRCRTVKREAWQAPVGRAGGD